MTFVWETPKGEFLLIECTSRNDAIEYIRNEYAPRELGDHHFYPERGVLLDEGAGPVRRRMWAAV